MPHNCGLVGLYSTQPCAESLWDGIFRLQHRGQRYCGIATFNKEISSPLFPVPAFAEIGLPQDEPTRFALITHKGYVRHTFTPGELNQLKGNFGIGHVSLKERQPILLNSKLGKFAIAFSGNIINADDLMAQLKSQGDAFSTNTQIELIARLIARAKDFVDGIEKMSKAIKGAYALVILTPRGIYAARGPYGFEPLILGGNGSSFCVASESRVFSILGMKIERDVQPGEIILINQHGFKTQKKLKSKRRARCAFEWGYIGSMDSIIDGIPVVKARKNLGASLARRDNVEADLVSPIPFSGIGYALGYHEASGIPYDEVFFLDRFATRSYTPLEQSQREEIARIKLSVIEETVRGRRIILCDDSIVRGTQMRAQVSRLKEAGAKEVHVRVGCPPIVAPCKYGISTRSYKELAAKKYSLDGIRKLIGADTLRYNTIEDFVKAIGLPANELCLSCWTGKYF